MSKPDLIRPDLIKPDLVRHDRTPETDLVTDVLVVGAGPAGCAAAITLAQAGVDVLLIDQHDFPRDKVCGDGLIPDAMQALEQLGVLQTVMQAATRVKGVKCHGPRGGSLRIPSDLAVLPRQTLDACLFDRAKAVGARTITGVRFQVPITATDGRVSGAQVTINGRTHKITANWTILATGASVAALKASGHCTESLPSAMALRAYVHNPAFVDDTGKAIEHLHISWHKAYAPGYAWIFPCPGGIFNVGVGLYGMHEGQREKVTTRQRRSTQSEQRSEQPSQRTLSSILSGLLELTSLDLTRSLPKKQNLAELFERFTEVNPMAKRLMQTGEMIGDIKGAPLRCSLEGAKPASPGMLITGEAMGSTYALTGEGIGKAMETGILSGEALLTRTTQNEDALVMQTYTDMLKNLKPKFTVYEQANKINRAPWLIDLAIARGNQSPRLVQRMSRVLEEKANPAQLFTWRGAWKLLTE
jgi:flavin-dependent dehydrogenase